MASNQEDSLLEDRNHPGSQTPASAGTFIEGTPSRDVLLRVLRSTVIQSNATIGQDFACGNIPMNSDFGYRDVTNYSHTHTVNAQMPALRGPMPMALQTST